MGHICELKGVIKEYRARGGLFDSERAAIQALGGVDLCLKENEILGLVGESGCGKSTLAKVLLGLERPTTGSVLFSGKDIASLAPSGLKAFRRQAQMVFQDPFSSLNPKKTVFKTLGEPMKIHSLCKKSELRGRVAALLNEVGLDASAMDLYPHEFSGGQRQRIGLARALATGPRLIVADEPTSALDVSIQAQVINLLMDLQERRGLTYLFISHDLPIIQFVSHRVAVMYKGFIVEIMPRGAFFGRGLDARRSPQDPLHHPYTEYLLKAVPLPDPRRRLSEAAGEIEDSKPDIPPPGGPKARSCPFHARCGLASGICLKARPQLRMVGDNHFISCHAV